jgi:aminoglycoside/choline kinase family phosphotransferase
MLSALAADSILWRPISEVEASIALGKIYAEHKMYDEAVREWEEVPVRNLLLRENVVLQLGRIYYSQDQLLKAIRLWEQLPESRLERLPNLRRAVHSAKVRLAQLAGKSYQQSLATYHAQRSDQTAVVESLRAALQYNRDLEGLLAHDGQRRRLPGEAADRLQLRAQAQAAVRARLEELELVLDQMAAAGLPIAPAEDRVTQAACRELDITPEELAKALAGAHAGRAAIERMERNPRPSRNTLYRAVLRWEDGASSSLLIKRYDDADITFFSACYRRERRVMELLHRYRCPVPQIFGGIEKEHHALLFLEDIGDDVLAEKLAGAGEAEKLTWLRAAIDSMVMLHSRARWHLSELEYETTQSMKETLSEQYYRDTFRIAVTRALGEQAEQDSAAWMEAARPLVDFLVGQPKTFIHFEFHPQNLLVHREQVHAVDFEQSTLGPPEFDLASLLKCPENDLAPEPIADLIEYYAARVHEVEGLTVTPTAHEVFDYANLFKSMFYAGAAANFHRKFGDPEHLRRRDWYLRDFDRVAARHPALARLRRLLAAARSASPDA